MNNVHAQASLSLLLAKAVLATYGHLATFPNDVIYNEVVEEKFRQLLAVDFPNASVRLDYVDGDGQTTFIAKGMLEDGSIYEVHNATVNGTSLKTAYWSFLDGILASAARLTVRKKKFNSSSDVRDASDSIRALFFSLCKYHKVEVVLSQPLIKPANDGNYQVTMAIQLPGEALWSLQVFVGGRYDYKPSFYKEIPTDMLSSLNDQPIALDTPELPKFHTGTFFRVGDLPYGSIVIGVNNEGVVFRDLVVTPSGEFLVVSQPIFRTHELANAVAKDIRMATFPEREALVKQAAVEMLAGGVSTGRFSNLIKDIVGQALSSTSAIYDAAAGLEQILRLPPPVLNPIKYFLMNNQPVVAIKVVRMLTGLGLKPSKDLAEVLRDQTPNEEGHSYSKHEIQDMLVYAIQENHAAVVDLFGQPPAKWESWDMYFADMTL